MGMKTLINRGFTIVELLIVVVVIAILASVTVVSYNGITQQARNAQTVSGAGEWVQLLNAYAAVNGMRLANNDDTPACLGGIENYPQTSDFDAGYCVGDWGAVATDANNKLKLFANVSGTWTTTYNSNFWGEPTRGIQYAHNGIIGSTNHQWITYDLQGDVDCGLAGATKTFGGGVTTCEVDVDLWID